MDTIKIREELAATFATFAQTVARPCGCARCGADRALWWNGFGVRSASLRAADGRIVYVPRIQLRRVRCPACRQSWTLWPPGLLARRHYQMCVVSQALIELCGQRVSEQRVANCIGCARRTVGRWLRWVAALAEPSELLARLHAVAGEPLLPPLGWARERLAAVRDAARRALLGRAAEVVGLLVALASACGVELAALIPAVAR
jgi:hypothetical protein